MTAAAEVRVYETLIGFTFTVNGRPARPDESRVIGELVDPPCLPDGEPVPPDWSRIRSVFGAGFVLKTSESADAWN